MLRFVEFLEIPYKKFGEKCDDSGLYVVVMPARDRILPDV